jgi:Zn-dependent peptidase ImmA (M78 family)
MNNNQMKLVEDAEANMFAMCLLMPEFLVRNQIDQRQIDVTNEEGVMLLANTFQVTPQMMLIRLVNLNIIEANT